MAKLNFFLTAFLLTTFQAHSAEKPKVGEEPVSEASKAASALKIKKGSVIWVDKKETVVGSEIVDGVMYIDKKVDITTTVEEPGQEKDVMYVEPANKLKKGSVIWVDKKETVVGSEIVDGVMYIDKKVDITTTVEEPGQEKGVMYVEPHKKFVVGDATAKDCEAMKVNGYYEDEYKACLKATVSKAKFNCEEVTEQYTVCNGVRYVVDLKNNDSLKRDIKKIENYIEPGKLKSGSNAVSK